MQGLIKSVLLFLFLAMFCKGTLAQKYAYVQYHQNTGAPFTHVSSVLKDEKGFVWIGSHNGLYRFDGQRYEKFSAQTKSQYIHQIYTDSTDLIFLNDAGLYRIDHLAGLPEVHTMYEASIEETANQPFYPNDFILSKRGTIWLSQSNHTVGKIEDNQFESFSFSKSEKAQHIALAESQDSTIWLLSPLDGLFSFDVAKNDFIKKYNLKNGKALLIEEDRIIIGGDQLYIFSVNKKKVQLIRTLTVEGDTINAIHQARDNSYFIGTEKGKLFLLADLKADLQTVYGANEAHRVRELNFGKIYAIHSTTYSVSSSGMIWICSETGLWLLKHLIFESVDNLPKTNPIEIAFGEDGKAWAPMNFLYEISPEDEGFTSRQILGNRQVNAVAYDRAGDIWVTVSNPEVAILKHLTIKVVEKYTFADRGESIFYLHADSKNNLWFCQSPLDKPINGVGRITPEGKVELYEEDDGFSSRVLVVKESKRGELYAAGIGEKSYLYLYDPEQNQFINLSPELPFADTRNFEVHDLTIDEQGIVWLATTDGLLRYDSEKVVLVQNEILGQEEVRGVAHLPNGSIWVATATKGLVFHQQNVSTLIDESAGLPSDINAYRCINVDASGRVWVGTPEGLVYSRIPEATLPLSNPPIIRKLSINLAEVSDNAKAVLKIEEGGRIDVEYSNLSFPSENIEYQYRILSKEEREVILEDLLWVSNHHHTKLTLDDLEKGNYFLEIRAQQPGGYLWSKALEVQFQVFQPWYYNIWILVPSTLVLLLITGYYFQYVIKLRVRQMQKILKFARDSLAEKEALLSKKSHELEVQQDILENVRSNIHTLELFVKEIPKKASWNDIITAMGKAVDESIDIDAFEICVVQDGEIFHKGYSKQERGGYTFRSKPFNPKTSLTSWAIENNKEVFIKDYDKEHELYIQSKEAYRFKSLIFVPFLLKHKQHAALCAYSTVKNQFDENDLVMVRILARFILLSAKQEIKKEI